MIRSAFRVGSEPFHVPHEVDLFKEEEQMVRMTFAEHLEDLRRHLIRALVGFVPAMIIGLFLGAPIVRYMREPARDALLEYYREELQARERQVQREFELGRPVTVVRVPYYLPREELRSLIEEVLAEGGDGRGEAKTGETSTRQKDAPSPRGDGDGSRSQQMEPAHGSGAAGGLPRGSPPRESVGGSAETRRGAAADEESPAPAGNPRDAAETWYERVLTRFGLKWDRKQRGALEQRQRLVAEKTLTASELNEEFLRIDLWTPRAALESAATLPDLDSAIISLGPYETFTAFLRASLLAGVVIASPWIFYQIWSFIAAGLYSYEKRVVYRFLPLAVGLFLAGVFFCFFIVLPVILNFLLSFNRWIGIKPQIRLSEWMGFATLLPLMFGLSFQLPIVMLALERVGIFSIDDYRSKRRVAILVLAFLSMMLTPPDPGSMLAMLLPAVGLYEMGIWMCRWGAPRPAAVPSSG